MKLKFKLIAAAVALAASAGANATMDNFMSGNGSLAFIALDSTGSPISVMMDLGYNVDSFLPTNTAAAGTTIAWNFNNNTLTVNGAVQAGAETAWSSAMSGFYATAQNAEVKWGVIAGDSLTDGGADIIRYASTTTSPLATVQNQTKSNLGGFNAQDLMINANNLLQTTGHNGSTATSGAGYVGQTFGTSARWGNKASFVALASEGTVQDFYEIDGVNGISATKALATAYAGQFNYSAGVLTYTVAVPEPETYAMFLAGLGLMGAIARRRLNRA